MSHYLLALAVIFLANLLPAFAPPTWTILIFFTLRYDLTPTYLVFLGVVGATAGRAILANSFRAIRRWLPRGYIANMEAIGLYIQGHTRRSLGLLALFFLSPISSAQLFEGAGIIKSVRLKPLLAAFAAGRLISYSIYVSGAHILKESSLGDLMVREMTSPKAIAIQTVLILGLIAMGNIKWSQRK